MNKKAKKQQSNGGNAAKNKVGKTLVINPEEEADIANIFDVISKKKQNQNNNTSANNKNNTTTSNDICKNNGNTQNINTKTVTSVKSEVNETSVPSSSDGLYHAPEKTLELSDVAFFDVPSQRKKRKNKNGNKTDSYFSEAVLQREGVSRIVTLEELQKITSSNPKAGSTPNCPFDCDCCF